ncbi:MAG: glycosyltransferase [Oscillospiraceae bacterium]|nr:glycosyltransferase [Oscillospiraceae bacterium]
MTIRVGLLNDSFPPTIDGVANTVYNYARVIQKGLGETVVITPKYPHVQDAYPFEVYRVPSFPMPKRVGYRMGNAFSKSTIDDLAGRKLDILHSHCPFASSVLATLVRKKTKAPIVFTYHTRFDVDIERRAIKPFDVIMKKLVKQNLRAANEIWIVSQGAAGSLRQMGYNGPYRVMENGTDFPRGLSSAETLSEINRAYNITPGQLVFLFTGRMMWYKGIKIILDALRAVKDNGVDFKMFFAGDGMDMPYIVQYTESLGLMPSVVFLGAVYDRERLRSFFSRANLFIFPSTYDTSGLVVKEAAACDLPSVLVRNSCPAEGVKNGVSGFLCEENAESCARVILAAVSDRARLAQVGRTAGQEVYLSWDDAATRGFRRYEEILASWPGEY